MLKILHTLFKIGRISSLARRVSTTLFIWFGLITLVTVTKNVQAQTINWVGAISSDYATATNWDVPTFNPLSPLGTEIVIIGAGNPNSPIQVGGNTSKRLAKLNTLPGAQFTVRGNLYANNSDMINGTVSVEGNADFNIRNIVTIGNGTQGTVTVSGGSITSKAIFYVGRNAGGVGTLNIWGGKVNAGTDFQVGTNGATGSVSFKSVGTLVVPGNKVAYLQGLLNSGIITVDGGRELDITYNATTNLTQASIKQDPNSLMKEFSDRVVLENGNVSMTIKKTNAEIISYKFRGFEMLTDGYYSMDGGTSYSQPSNCQFTIKTLTNDITDVSFKSVWTTGMRAQAFDIDVHFVLERSGAGVYTYALLSHPANYPTTGVGEWRMVWKLNQNQVENIFIDDARHMQMPTSADIAAALPTSIAEAIKLTSGVKNGQFECKYNYNVEYEKVGTYGHASNINNVGSWLVFGGFDYFNDGPTKQDLSAALGIIHVHFGRNHYGGSTTSVVTGEQWSKIYGPFMLYNNFNSAGADACWADAKAKALEEKSKWPYTWLTNTPQYPADSMRGSITGRFVVQDSFKPAVTGGNAMIGVAQPDPGGNWQFESKRYQYWVKTNADGTFTIPHVRPGSYTLYAFTDGETGEYKQANVVISAGQVNNIGDLVWQIARNKGQLLWEIGVADRTAKEFKHGNDYFQPFLWEKYSKELTNPLVYNVGQSNWATDWNYAHSGYLRSDTTLVAWPWQVNFNIAALPATGNATLTIAFAGSDHARMDIYVNDNVNAFAHFYPDAGGGDGLVREGIHSKYGVSTLQIPISKLHKGINTITLVQGRAAERPDHVMYDYLSLEVPPNHIPVASFNATPQSGNAPLRVSFNAHASHDDDGVPLTYQWDFGDGTFGTGVDTVHTYAHGIYLAKLIVTDNNNASDTTSITITALNNPPVASFTATPTSGYAPLLVTLDASLTRDIDHDSITYQWNFGDGTSGSGINALHTYKHGVYTATLIATDNNHAADTTFVTITVLNNAPVAAFTATPTSGYAPLIVNLDASLTHDIDQDSLTYYWIFGDGSYGSGSHAVHTYTHGVYTATLIVTDNYSASDTTSLTITARNNAPVAVITATPTSGSAPLLVNLDASLSHDIDHDSLTYQWIFGDGSFSTGINATHTYTHGVYHATLIVVDSNFASDTILTTITVLNNAPLAAFTATPTSGYAPLLVKVDASLSADIDHDSITYAWDFGDGATAMGIQAQHLYTSPGTYSILLTATDKLGAIGSATKTVTTTSGLKVQYKVEYYEINPFDGSINPNIKIVNTSTSPVPYNELSARYWYTKEGTSNQVFKCEFAQLGTSKVKGNFVPLAQPRTGADYYLELTFSSANAIPASGNSGEIETMITKVNHSFFDERDDYSYDPTKKSYADWNHITLYRNGKLFWGVEPDTIATPPPGPGPGEGHASCHIYPNPTHGQVHIDGNLTERGDVTISVYSLLGVRLIQEDLGSHAAGAISHVIETTSLHPGLYLVKVVLANSSFVSLLIKE